MPLVGSGISGGWAAKTQKRLEGVDVSAAENSCILKIINSGYNPRVVLASWKAYAEQLKPRPVIARTWGKSKA